MFDKIFKVLNVHLKDYKPIELDKKLVYNILTPEDKSISISYGIEHIQNPDFLEKIDTNDFYDWVCRISIYDEISKRRTIHHVLFYMNTPFLVGSYLNIFNSDFYDFSYYFGTETYQFKEFGDFEFNDVEDFNISILDCSDLHLEFIELIKYLKNYFGML